MEILQTKTSPIQNAIKEGGVTIKGRRDKGRKLESEKKSFLVPLKRNLNYILIAKWLAKR